MEPLQQRFFSIPPIQKREVHPSMTGAVGGGTENGTWAAGVFHVGYWKQDRLRYTGAIMRTNANLKFYGSGLALGDDPVNLNLNAWVLFQQLKGRMGNESRYILSSRTNSKVHRPRIFVS